MPVHFEPLAVNGVLPFGLSETFLIGLQFRGRIGVMWAWSDEGIIGGREANTTRELKRQNTALAQFGELALRSEELDEILTEACRWSDKLSAQISRKSWSCYRTARPLSCARE